MFQSLSVPINSFKNFWAFNFIISLANFFKQLEVN